MGASNRKTHETQETIEFGIHLEQSSTVPCPETAALVGILQQHLPQAHGERLFHSLEFIEENELFTVLQMVPHYDLIQAVVDTYREGDRPKVLTSMLQEYKVITGILKGWLESYGHTPYHVQMNRDYVRFAIARPLPGEPVR